MDSCKKNYMMFMFFYIKKSVSKTKLLLFEMQSIKKHYGGLSIATTCLPAFQVPGNVLFALLFLEAFFKLTNIYLLISTKA